MERILAVVTNGVVSNVLVVDPNDFATIAHFGGLLLPQGSPVGIGHVYDGTNFAAPAVAPPTPTEQRAAIQTEIDSLERANLMPRVTREFLLLAAVQQAVAQGVNESTLYAANIGYRKVKDFDAQIMSLRSQIGAIK